MSIYFGNWRPRQGNILEEFLAEIEAKGKPRFDWSRSIDWSRAKVYDLSQPLGPNTPPFPTYPHSRSSGSRLCRSTGLMPSISRRHSTLGPIWMGLSISTRLGLI